MQWIKAFIGGFLATLIFHQGLLALLSAVGPAPAPYNFSAVPPLGVPAVISLAFWGGVWGVPIWWLMRRFRGAAYWVTAIIAGAIGPTLVAMLVVFPLKELPVNAQTVVVGLVLNGFWGLGLALFMRVAVRR